MTKRPTRPFRSRSPILPDRSCLPNRPNGMAVTILASESQGARGRSGLFPLHDVRHHPGRNAPGRTLRPCRATQQVTGCLDPLVRAGKRKCARPKHDSGAEGTGGARRDRTDDLMLAKHALSQLSYGPIGVRRFASARPMFMLASGAGDRIRDLGYRAIRRGARSGFGSAGDCHQSVLKMSARAQRARKAECPPALMRGTAKVTDVTAGD